MRTLRIASLAAAASLTLSLSLAATPSLALEVVYVTRHAQKDPAWNGDGRLRPLTERGAACAAALSDRLASEDLAAVYSSETTRTLSTAAAVASASAAPVMGDDASTKPVGAWAESLLARHAADHAVLVVGHSTTVDDLVLAFRPDALECFSPLGLARPEIPETQYGDLWRLELGAEATAAGCDSVERSPISEGSDAGLAEGKRRVAGSEALLSPARRKALGLDCSTP